MDNFLLFVVAKNRRKNRKNVCTMGVCGAHTILIAKNTPYMHATTTTPKKHMFVFQHGIIETLNGLKNPKSSKFTSGEFASCMSSSTLISCSANASLNSLLSSQI